MTKEEEQQRWLGNHRRLTTKSGIEIVQYFFHNFQCDNKTYPCGQCVGLASDPNFFHADDCKGCGHRITRRYRTWHDLPANGRCYPLQHREDGPAIETFVCTTEGPKTVDSLCKWYLMDNEVSEEQFKDLVNSPSIW